MNTHRLGLVKLFIKRKYIVNLLFLIYNYIHFSILDLLGSDDSSDEDGSDDESGSDEDDEEDFEEAAAKKAEEMEIIDKTETNLVALRRLIYLTIQSRFL